MIEVQKLTKRYGATTAIEDVSFTVPQGEVVGFLGPNGAGKTTTMRIITGSLGATEGTVTIDGLDVFKNPRKVKKRIGYLPEVPPLYPDMTVKQYVSFAGRMKGVEDPGGAADKVIDRVGLGPIGHRIIDHLSKGYRQRVGLAQALVHDPEVLILDEPNSGLDPAQRVEIRELLKSLAAEDRTVILSTHVLADIEAMCKSVVIISKGRVVAQDDIAALGADRHAVEVQLEEVEGAADALSALDGILSVKQTGPGHFYIQTQDDCRRDIARAAVEFGLLELQGRQRLEDIFLRLTEDTFAPDADDPPLETSETEVAE
ncbi:MAG: ATP-binding cassette domain-containing protein [Proteobacteria bacterium]|nr:ATP-binding cassette domain-containing protein [Pseudomonadota bacterium]MCP4917140.1 ATP-binding cassette domain-containing protein [Pseudomonadota bacterium]